MPLVGPKHEEVNFLLVRRRVTETSIRVARNGTEKLRGAVGNGWKVDKADEVSIKAGDMRALADAQVQSSGRAESSLLGVWTARKANCAPPFTGQCPWVAGPQQIVQGVWARVKEPGEHVWVFPGCGESAHRAPPLRPSLFGGAKALTPLIPLPSYPSSGAKCVLSRWGMLGPQQITMRVDVSLFPPELVLAGLHAPWYTLWSVEGLPSLGSS